MRLIVVHADPLQLQGTVPAVAPQFVDPVLLADHLPELQKQGRTGPTERQEVRTGGCGKADTQPETSLEPSLCLHLTGPPALHHYAEGPGDTHSRPHSFH